MKEKIFFQSQKGYRLCGILSDPSGNKKNPIILLCHGFSTSKNGRTYLRLEKMLNEKNLATLRFDFFGHGESEGKFEDITVSEAVDDVLCAIKYLKNFGYGKIGLFGSSFGGIASILAAGQSEKLYVLALKSPVSDYLALLSARDSGRELKVWKEKGFMNVTGADGQSLRLNYIFFEDAEKIDGYAAAKNIKVPTQIVHGDRDETVPLEQSVKAAQLIPGCRLKIIKGADHIYSNPRHFEQLLQLVSRFLVGVKP